MRAAILKDAPHHEKVFFVADSGDDAQLLLHLRAHGSGTLAVAPPQSVEHELVEKLARRGTVRRLERGELRFAEGQLEVAPLGKFTREAKPIRMVFAGVGHFRR